MNHQREQLVSDDVTDVYQTASALQNLQLGSSCKEWAIEIEKLNGVINDIKIIGKERDSIKEDLLQCKLSIDSNKHILKGPNNVFSNVLKESIKNLIPLLETSYSRLKESLTTKSTALQRKIVEYEQMRNDVKADYADLMQKVEGTFYQLNKD